MIKGRITVIIIAIASIILIIHLILSFVPAVGVTHTKLEPYTTTETYTEKEPYTITETYYETEPIIKSQPLQFTVVSSSITDFGWGVLSSINSGTNCYVKIQNLDYENGGTFYVLYNMTIVGGATATRNGSLYIGPGQQGTITGQYYGARVSSFTYSITPATKQVIDSQQVAKTREVTKIRDVEKTREVTKIREVKKHKTISVFRSFFD